MLYPKEAEQKMYIASNPLVVMLFGGGAALKVCFCDHFEAILFSKFSALKHADSLPNEGGLGWVLTNHTPNKASDFNTIPLRVVTHPNLPSLGKECSTLSAGFLSNDGRSEWGTLSRQLQAYSLAPCGRGQNFKLSSAKLRNSGEGSTPAQRRSTC